MSHPPRDLTPLPDLLHGAALAGRCERAGPSTWTCSRRAMRAARPGRTSRPGWPASRPGEHEHAWRQLVADNPLPAIHGRVCYHPCESVCNRAELDSSVSIHAVERFLGDLRLNEGWPFDPPPAPTGQRVLVIGAGPSGLSAAYHLARRGHQVEISDASPEPGGMMRYGIPAYRLPRDVLAGEIARIEALGVTITCGHRVTDLAAEQAEGRSTRCSSRSARTCPSTWTSRPATPAASWTRCRSCVTSRRRARPVIGRRVAVYGGGNTAMDAARSPAGSAPTTRRSSTGGPGPRCPRTRKKPRTPSGRASASTGCTRSPPSTARR